MKKADGIGHRVMMAGRLVKKSASASSGPKTRRPVGVVVKIKKGGSFGTAISLEAQKPRSK